MIGRTAKSASPLVFVAAMLGCAGGSAVDGFDAGGRVWPESPYTARVEFVREFSSLADLGVRSSFWDRLIEAAAGKEDDRMLRPMAVVSASDGSAIYVADPDARCVHRYDTVKGRYTCLKNKGGEPPLASPVGLAMTDDGTLLVSDSETGRIFRLTPGQKWLVPVELQVELKQPTGIVWDSDTGHIFVVETGRQQVVALSGEGTISFEIGERGNLPGQFNFPTYLWISDDNELYVVDSLNFRVQVFTKQGEFVRAFGVAGDHAGDFARPKGIAVDRHGHVYVVDALFHAMQIFNADGDLMLTLGGQGQGDGEFWLPNGIFIDDTNMILVADTHNKRIQVFRYVGPGS
jgi:sugar lactone lactonase YvrE